MKEGKNLVLQIVGYSSDSERASRTSEIYRFSELIHCKCVVIDDGFHDSFVVYPSDDDCDFCHQVNAFAAFCHFHCIAMKLENYS